MKITLTSLHGRWAVVQLAAESDFRPENQSHSKLFAVIQTAEETTIICPEADAPLKARVEKGWSVLKINEALDFALVGILADISAVLAQAGISIFVLSTYNTDYILVKEIFLETAVQALDRAGYSVIGPE